MFQFAAGLEIAKKFNLELSLDELKISRGFTDHGSSLREYKSISFKEPTLNSFARPFVPLRILFTTLIYKIFKGKILKPNNVGFEEIKVGGRPWRLAGYFQSWKFHDASLAEVRASFSEPRQKSEWYEARIEELKGLEVLAIHVRRGDYKTLKEVFGLLDAKYYRKAISQLVSKGANPAEIWIFTDSANIVEINDVCLALSEFKAPKVIIEPPGHSSDAESLLIMSKCQSIVIANSTFSWWAARLSEAKYIARPSTWFVNQSDPRDLFPPDWIEIQSEWCE